MIWVNFSLLPFLPFALLLQHRCSIYTCYKDLGYMNCWWGQTLLFLFCFESSLLWSRGSLQLVAPRFIQSVWCEYCMLHRNDHLVFLLQMIITTGLPWRLNIELRILSLVSGDILRVSWWMLLLLCSNIDTRRLYERSLSWTLACIMWFSVFFPIFLPDAYTHIH